MFCYFPVPYWASVAKDDTNRRVTDGVDIEAIREYEANQARMDGLDAEANEISEAGVDEVAEFDQP